MGCVATDLYTPAEPAMTVTEALRHGSDRLATHEDLRDTAKPDARQLLEIATGLTRVGMLAAPNRELSAKALAKFDGLLERRIAGAPIQYLRGSQEFYGRSFAVSPAVLIPRPETELIVEMSLNLFRERAWPLRIVDVGTGSGVLAVTLALEFPESTVVALDLSTDALKVAQGNAASLGLGHRMLAGTVRFEQSDLLAAAGGERIDLIVSNPPYVPLEDAPELHRQVRDYEPHLALFGGADGHDVLRRLILQAWNCLEPGGWLLLETGGRTAVLDDLLAGWSNVRFLKDLRGIERIAVARRSMRRVRSHTKLWKKRF